MQTGRSIRARSVGAWYVLGVLLLSFIFNYLDRSILSILVTPIQHDLKISDTSLGLLQGVAFALFYGIFSLPISRLADAGNRRNLLMIGTVVWCAATAGCGAVHSTVQLFVARILVAVGEAVLMPCAVSMLADLFPRQERGRAFGVFSMGAYLGGAAAFIGGGVLFQALSSKTHYGPWGSVSPWRAVFMIVGLLGLMVVPLLVAVREPARLRDDGLPAEASSTVGEVWSELRKKRAAVSLVVLGYSFVAMTGQTLQLWLPTLFVRIHGWGIKQVGIRLGVTALVLGPLGSITGGMVADILGRRGRSDSKIMVGAGGALVSACAGVLLTLRSDIDAMGGVALFYFFFGLSFGLAQASIADLVPNRMRAQTIALYGLLNNLLGVVLGPVLVGLLNDDVFHDTGKINLSLRIVVSTSFLIAVVLLCVSRGSVRRVLSEIPLNAG